MSSFGNKYFYDLNKISITESLKVYYPHYKNDNRNICTFTLQCPNLDHQLTLSLLHDATVRGDIHYHDVCKVTDSVTIAYNNVCDKNNHNCVFEVKEIDYDPDNKTLVESHVIPVKGWYSSITRDSEIIKSFLDHYSLTPTWIDCKKISGTFDEETGTWTGAVGKVRNCNL